MSEKALWSTVICLQKQTFVLFVFFSRSEMTVLHCTANTVILFPYTRFYFVTYYIIAFLSVSQRYDILLISTHNRRVVIIILTYYRADKL